MKRCAALLGILLFAATAVQAQDPPAPPAVTAAVSAQPAITCSASFGSALTLTGFNNGVPGTADIMFVMDESGSINNSEWAQLDAFVDATIAALDLANTGNRVGIVKYSSDRSLVLPLTSNAVQASILPRFFPGGSTRTDFGIQAADAHLIASARPEASKFIIVLTDGISTSPTGLLQTAANAAKSHGATLLAVGVAGADVPELNLIASAIPGVQTVFFATQFEQLGAIVSTLIDSIVTPGATNVRVTVDAMPRFPIETALASVGDVNIAGGQVIWTLPSLGASTAALQLTHMHDGIGNGPLQVFSATYSDAEGHAVSIGIPSTNVTGCNTPPSAHAGVDQTAPLAGATATVTLDGSASADDGLVQPLTYTWSSNSSVNAVGVSPSVVLPLGTHMFTLTVNDGEFSAQDTVVITVVDATAPVIGSVTPSTDQLGPANHKLVSVAIAVAATDNSGAVPVCTITSATSNEPDNGLGDGDTAGDITITGPLSVSLRSERSGNGNGRIYTIAVTCTDPSGNASSSEISIVVPKSNGRGR